MSQPNDPTELTSLGALPDPLDDPVAGLLTEVFASEANQIEPADRLVQIRDQVRRGSRPWKQVVASAAAIVVVAGGATWAATHRTSGRPAASAHPVAGGPTAGPAVSPEATAATPTTPPGGHVVTVPVYFPGAKVPGLFREFQRAVVTIDNPERRVEAALRLAVDPFAPSPPNETSSWLPGTAGSLTAEFVNTEQVLVSLPAAEGQARGRTREQARLAAQQLVWTVTAVMQDPALRVRIRIGGQAGQKLFASLPTTSLFSRPSAAESFTDLSPIWVLAPEPGSTVTGRAVTVSGQACTFEGTVQWQLLKAGAVARSGHTQATSGCPSRGTWKVSLKALAVGDYTLRAYELSAKDGVAVVAEDTTTFTVR